MLLEFCADVCLLVAKIGGVWIVGNMRISDLIIRLVRLDEENVYSC